MPTLLGETLLGDRLLDPRGPDPQPVLRFESLHWPHPAALAPGSSLSSAYSVGLTA